MFESDRIGRAEVWRIAAITGQSKCRLFCRSLPVRNGPIGGDFLPIAVVLLSNGAGVTGRYRLVDCDNHSVFGTLELVAIGVVEHIVTHVREDKALGA